MNECVICYRLLSEHSVPMVIHHIGSRVLTIEVSTHADVGDMNMRIWKSQTERYTQVKEDCQGIPPLKTYANGSSTWEESPQQCNIYKLLTFFTELLTEFHICPLTSNMT